MGSAWSFTVPSGVYGPRGSYQLHAERMEEAGRGDLHEAFLRRKAKLEAEGLFDPARKRALPRFPRPHRVITSRDGAALRDILRVLGARWPVAEVLLRPGAGAGGGRGRRAGAGRGRAERAW